MWVCRLPVHIDPAGCTGFTEILGEFVTSHWADRVVGPYVKALLSPYLRSGGRLCPPAGRTAFYGNLRRIRSFPTGRQSRRPLQNSGESVLPCKFCMQGVFTAAIQRQLLTNLMFRNRRRVP